MGILLKSRSPVSVLIKKRQALFNTLSEKLKYIVSTLGNLPSEQIFPHSRQSLVPGTSTREHREHGCLSENYGNSHVTNTSQYRNPIVR